MAATDAQEFALDSARVARAFSRAARRYDQHAVLQQTVRERLIERLDIIRVDPVRVLDAGSGTGAGARALARRYRAAEVLELDLAFGMLAESRRRRRWLRRNPQICADVTRLPLKAGALDLIVSSLMLQWCTDIDAVFAEFQRALKPNGLLLFATLGPDTLKELRSAWRAVDAAPHVHAFIDMHDLGDALIRAGFASPVLDVEHIVLTYPDVRAVLTDLRSLGAANAARGRPGGLTGKRAWRQFLTAYEAQRNDGRIPATFEVIYAHAWSSEVGARPQDGSTVAVSPLRFVPRRRN